MDRFTIGRLKKIPKHFDVAKQQCDCNVRRIKVMFGLYCKFDESNKNWRKRDFLARISVHFDELRLMRKKYRGFKVISEFLMDFYEILLEHSPN